MKQPITMQKHRFLSCALKPAEPAFSQFPNYFIILVMPCLLCEIHRDLYSHSSEGMYLYLLLSDNVNLSVCCRCCRGGAGKGQLLIVLLVAVLMNFHGLTSISKHFDFQLFFSFTQSNALVSGSIPGFVAKTERADFCI